MPDSSSALRLWAPLTPLIIARAEANVRREAGFIEAARLSGNGETRAPWNYGITPGEVDNRKMNELTNALMRVHPYGDNLPDEGDIYGPGLQKMVRDFQHRANIKASGIVGPKTWAALYEAVAVSGGWGC